MTETGGSRRHRKRPQGHRPQLRRRRRHQRHAGTVGDYFGAVIAARKPVIAAIDGYAVGGGFELALASDIALCAPDAVRTIKRVVREGRNVPTDYVADFSEPFRDAVHNSATAAEGARAFAEKRRPISVTTP